MSYDTSGIAERLQTARKSKGLSQRELSELAGIPQAQISRIEAGSVDLRLSSLVALTHALDLELALVPRKAVPIVRSLSRDAMSSSHKDVVAVQKEMQRLGETVRRIQISMPDFEGLQRLQKSLSDLYRFRAPMLDLDPLKKLRQTIEQISRPEKEVASLNESLNIIRMIHNNASHDPLPDSRGTLSRPAYSLDEESDDA